MQFVTVPELAVIASDWANATIVSAKEPIAAKNVLLEPVLSAEDSVISNHFTQKHNVFIAEAPEIAVPVTAEAKQSVKPAEEAVIVLLVTEVKYAAIAVETVDKISIQFS